MLFYIETFLLYWEVSQLFNQMPSIVIPLLVDKAHWTMFHETMKPANEIMIYSNFGKQRNLAKYCSPFSLVYGMSASRCLCMYSYYLSDYSYTLEMSTRLYLHGYDKRTHPFSFVTNVMTSS